MSGCGPAWARDPLRLAVMERLNMSREIIFQDYVVGLIDFLNQGNQLEMLNTIPETDDQKPQFIEAAKRTLGVVDSFRRAFREFFEKSMTRSPSGLRGQLTERQKEEYDRFVAVEIGCQHFSDTTVIYSPLVNRKGALTLHGVHNMLIAAGSTLLSALAARVAFRGGIEVGVGAEYWPNEIYGPVLRHAYSLESTVADYPRVVLGDEVMAFIQHAGVNQESDRLAALNRDVAGACKALIRVDQDGMPIVDYLGSSFRNFARGMDYDALIQQAFGFVDSEHKRFKNEKNHKLALRYARLRQYFRARA